MCTFFGQQILLLLMSIFQSHLNRFYHHHQSINIPTAGAQALLWIIHEENGP
jgi:hypothetical protein